MVELRPNISGKYKGLIYCLDLNEALDISQNLNIIIKNTIRFDLISKVKRGCSEYYLEYPKYKEIKIYGDQPMNYNESWRRIEKEIDKYKKDYDKVLKAPLIDTTEKYTLDLLKEKSSIVAKIEGAMADIRAKFGTPAINKGRTLLSRLPEKP